jgi:hypothetical protein
MTFWLVTQCVNQLHHCAPWHNRYRFKLTACHSYLKPYCEGRRIKIFSVAIYLAYYKSV